MILTGALAGLGLLLLTGLWAVQILEQAPRSFTQDVDFLVERGQGWASVADRLASEGIVPFAESFLALTVLYGRQGDLKAGQYRLEAGMSSRQILEKLSSGRETLRRLTIPEGWTIGKISRYLEDQQILSAEAFRQAARNPELLAEFQIPAASFEGFLFPDTYLVPPSLKAEDLVRLMAANFFRRIRSLFPEEQETLPMESLFPTLILASIVEREYRVPEEAPLMASVFANRLRIGMGLGSCATLEYIITEVQGRPHPRRILYADTQIRHAYNTYVFAGLPPGPISNPGLTALKAALAPPRTDYFYFVVRDASRGTHTFSRTLNAHNTARDAYLLNFQTKN